MDATALKSAHDSGREVLDEIAEEHAVVVHEEAREAAKAFLAQVKQIHDQCIAVANGHNGHEPVTCWSVEGLRQSGLAPALRAAAQAALQRIQIALGEAALEAQRQALRGATYTQKAALDYAEAPERLVPQVAMDRPLVHVVEVAGRQVEVARTNGRARHDLVLHEADNCGTGDGGFKAGNTCATRRLHRGDAALINEFDIRKTDPQALFGQGVYLTSSKRIAGDYGSKGNQGVVFRYKGKRGGNKQAMIDSYLRNSIAPFMNERGEMAKDGEEVFGRRFSTFAGERWKGMGEDPRLKFARDWWAKNSGDFTARLNADGTGSIAKGKQIGRVSTVDVPERVLKRTVDAEAEPSEEVVGALYETLAELGDRGTAVDMEKFATAEDDDGFRPSYRDIYTSIAADSPVATEEGQALFRSKMRKLGYSGIKYAGGVTIGGAGRHDAFLLWDDHKVAQWRRKESHSVLGHLVEVESGEATFWEPPIEARPDDRRDQVARVVVLGDDGKIWLIAPAKGAERLQGSWERLPRQDAGDKLQSVSEANSYFADCERNDKGWCLPGGRKAVRVKKITGNHSDDLAIHILHDWGMPSDGPTLMQVEHAFLLARSHTSGRPVEDITPGGQSVDEWLEIVRDNSDEAGAPFDTIIDGLRTLEQGGKKKREAANDFFSRCERDDKGWCIADGGGDSGNAARDDATDDDRGVSRAYEFYSPNIRDTGNTPELAVEEYESKNFSHFLRIARDVDRTAGLESRQTRALGDWTDGAEASVVAEFKGPISWDDLRYSTAKKAWAMKQKGAVMFKTDPNGKSRLYSIDVRGMTYPQLRASLDRHGIDNRTIVPRKNGEHRVLVFDEADKLERNVLGFGGEHVREGQISFWKGSGEIPGKDDRDEAGRYFERIAEDWERRHPGRTYRRVRAADDRGAEGEGLSEAGEFSEVPEGKSYFSICPRDENGYCMASGASGVVDHERPDRPDQLKFKPKDKHEPINPLFHPVDHKKPQPDDKIDVNLDTLKVKAKDKRGEEALAGLKSMGIELPEVVDNILWVAEEGDKLLAGEEIDGEPAFQHYAKWYAVRNAEQYHLAKDLGIPHEAVTGVVAATSPQTEWNRNWKQAQDVVRIYMDNEPLTITRSALADLKRGAMDTYAKNRGLPAPSTMLGGLSAGDKVPARELPPMVAAYLLEDGPSAKAGTSTAWRIIGGEEPNMSLGGPKVRSFYNNMLNPHDQKSVTIDTHAIRMLLADPSIENTGKTYQDVFDGPYKYDFYRNAIRAAAKRRGMTPSALQAVTWNIWKEKIHPDLPSPTPGGRGKSTTGGNFKGPSREYSKSGAKRWRKKGVQQGWQDEVPF